MAAALEAVGLQGSGGGARLALAVQNTMGVLWKFSFRTISALNYVAFHAVRGVLTRRWV